MIPGKLFTIIAIVTSGLVFPQFSYAQAYDLFEHDLWPGKSWSNPRGLYNFKDKLYFIAEDSVRGTCLWEVQEGGIAQISQSFSNYMLAGGSMASLHGKLYFPGYDSVHGEELWVYDGTGNPKLAFDVFHGSSSSLPRSLVAVGNSLFFIANDSTAQYRELFEFDPTNKTTYKRTNLSKDNTFLSGVSWLKAFNDRIVMSVYNNVIGRELFLYDPKMKIAWMLHDIAPGNDDSYSNDLFVYKDKLFFTASDRAGVLDTFQLYIFDGVKAPHKIKELDDIGVYKYANYNTTVLYRNHLYILTRKTVNGGWWVYKLNPDDFTGEMVDDINNEFGANLMNFFVHNDGFTFEGLNNDGKPGRLWQYKEDGPPVSIADFEYANSQIRELTTLGNSMFFIATTRENGRELFELKLNSSKVELIPPGTAYKLYPNPVHEDAYLEVKVPESRVLETTVVNMNGHVVYYSDRILFSAALHKLKIPMAGLAAGVYLYTVTDNTGTLVAEGKIIKN